MADNRGALLVYPSCHLIGSLEDSTDVLQPTALFKLGHEPRVAFLMAREDRLARMLERLAHSVDVLDVHELYFGAAVVRALLVAFPHGLIRQSVLQRACIVDDQFFIPVPAPNMVEQLLVALISGILNANFRLAATPYCRTSNNVAPNQHRDSASTSKLSNAEEVLVTDGARDHKVARVCRAQLVLFVYVGDPPLFVFDIESMVVFLGVVEIPPIQRGWHFDVELVRKGEA
mmetsp:Transcript_33523/g.53995  ORF Transcript_33523/g.53995 Transcript_33523/m.53995 type:complete len:231 (-) Transcript_33523:200-892(-)